MNNPEVAYGGDVLPHGIRSRFVDNGRGLRMHVLEAGRAGDPAVVLLHGFPELAFSWRKVMLPLAAAGHRVLAPDQRGYGRTTGSDDRYDCDVRSFRYLDLVEDVVGLLHALGIASAAAVIGHDFGSPVAAWAALTRPSHFRAVALMSAPFPGPPAPPVPGSRLGGPSGGPDVHADLAALPRPRKHYMWYYATREANERMRRAPQGLHDFLRAYYHVKSADWAANDPQPLSGWTAEELAKLPTYYVMDLDRDMPATVAPGMPTPGEIAACEWLTDAELAVYVGEYARTGFQGGLNWYRCAIDPDCGAELQAWAGRQIEVPATFIGGKQIGASISFPARCSAWRLRLARATWARTCSTARDTGSSRSSRLKPRDYWSISSRVRIVEPCGMGRAPFSFSYECQSVPVRAPRKTPSGLTKRCSGRAGACLITAERCVRRAAERRAVRLQEIPESRSIGKPLVRGSMTTDLWMLVYTAFLTLALPYTYIAGRSLVPGSFQWGVGNRATPLPGVPEWAERAHRAHVNLTENLGPFAILVLVAHLSARANATTALGATMFFWARAAHAAVYIAGVTYVRSLVFAASLGGELLVLSQLF